MNTSVMQYEDTICFKVNECTKEMQRAIKTGTFDPLKVTQLLVKIRSDAIQMENALKANKVLRSKYKIDDEYRDMMKEERHPTKGIHNLPNESTTAEKTPKFDITLKDDTGEIVYQNRIHAFIMCAVEEIEDIDEAGIIDGKTQCLTVGHDIAIWYAYDQLKQKISAKMAEIMVAMAHNFRNNSVLSRQQRRRLIQLANRTKK